MLRSVPAALMGLVLLSVFVLTTGCGKPKEENATGPAPRPLGQGGGSEVSARLSGDVSIDGSSTVYPITEAVAERFRAEQPGVKTTVGISGTGGGFKKFGVGETHISDASRPIKAVEIETCRKSNIDFIELPIAYDALAVVVNPENTWATTLTVEELKGIWEPAAEGTVIKWSDIRAGFPDEPLTLFAPGVDSGTYDYFTEAICGKEGASRGDVTTSEDDNVLVQGVAGDVNALGFFGMAYYQENEDKVKAVLIDDGDPSNGDGGVAPLPENVVNGTYQPLSRPLFIYVSKAAKEKPQVKAFVDFYLENAGAVAVEVGYVQLPDEVYKLAKQRFEDGVTGSVFEGGGSKIGLRLEDLLKVEKSSG